VQQHVSYESIR